MLEFLSPSKKVKGKSNGVGILISGTNLEFNAETVAELGLKDHVNFGIDKDHPGKLFITKDADTQKFILLGGNNKAGKKYINDPKVAKTAKLVNGEFYFLKKSDQGNYINYNPDAQWKEPTSKNNKDVAETIKKNRENATDGGETPKKKKVANPS